MKRLRHNYVGITLLFAKKVGFSYEAQKMDYLIRARSSHDIEEVARRIAHSRIARLAGGHSKSYIYLGLYDAFSIVGPIGEGMILGFTPTKSCRTLKAAASILQRRKRKKSYLSMVSPPFYLADLVFYVGKPTPYNLRMAFECFVPVKANSAAQAKRRVRQLIGSHSFRRRLKIFLGQSFSLKGLVFLGTSNVVRVVEGIETEKCYHMSVKRFSSLASIRRLMPRVSPARKYNFAWSW